MEKVVSRINKELIDPTTEPVSEKFHRVASATVASVPIIGGAAVEVFRALIEPPMSKRQTEWMVQVTDALNGLYESGLVTEFDLQQNERFFTTLVNASNVAIRNHEKAKLEALKNAVLNSALPNSPDDTKQQLYLNLIERYTSWHLALLVLFQGPDIWAENNSHSFPNFYMGSISSVIESAYPELGKQPELCQLVWKDLYLNGLLDTDNFNTTMSAAGMLAKRTTQFGDEFINFISCPQNCT
ncbi:hypothetical protein AB1F87_004005 [Vibrio mimicus]